MNKFSIILIALIVMNTYLAKAQGFSYQDNEFQQSLSPQASDFMKFGNVPVSYFTGEANVRIPVYTYKDKDFSLPIYLGYNSDGFKPNKREGIIGLDWFINAGGMIIRKVNGTPDDHMGSSYLDPDGWYYGINQGNSIASISKSDLFNLEGLDGGDGNYYWEIDDCETQPDEFSFNAPGCSGKFLIQNDGTIHCIGDKNYDVDLSDFHGQPNTLYLYDSKITITSDNGFKYEFGGSIRYLEMSYPLDSDGELNAQSVIIGWYLSKIIAPNNREVNFYYMEHPAEFPNFDTCNEGHYLLNIHDFDYAYATSITGTGDDWLDKYRSYSGGSGHETVYELTKTAFLEKIEIDESTTIDFSYSQRENKFYVDKTTTFNLLPLELDRICVKYNNETIKTFLLDYEYTGGSSGKRYFLSGFQESGKQAYSFSYYNQSQIPDPLTHGIDYWGFWNGGSASNNLIPSMQYNINGYLEYTSTIRESNEDKCDVGLLEQINYPTGGYTQFVYEGNQYSQRLERRVDNSFLPALYSETGDAGGARIKKIIDNDGSGKEIKKEYKYFKNYPDSTTSSGILLDWPRYVYFWINTTDSFEQIDIKKNSDGFHTNYSKNEKFIQYSEVTEILSPDNGYTVYKFTNFETNPDIIDHDTVVVLTGLIDGIVNLDLYNNYVGIKNTDCSFQRGYPYETSVYSNSGTLLKRKKVTSFTSLANYPNDYLVGALQTGGIAASYKVYYCPFLPLSKTESFYYDDDSVCTTTSYVYNNYNQVSEKSFTNSNEDNIAITYKYPIDINAGTYASMVDSNMINYPIEQTTLKNDNVTASSLTTYKSDDGIYVPDKVYSLETSSSLSSFTSFDGTTKDSHYGSTSETEFVDYDSNGNLLEYKTQDGITTSFYYIEDYCIGKPVIMAENMTYSELESAVNSIVTSSIGLSLPETYEFLEMLSVEDIESFIEEFNNTVNFVQVTGYTYKPLVGMTSQTNPNGVTTYYEYDDFGRLKTVKDDDENILKQYDYHYAE